MLSGYATICSISLLIAVFFWYQGATLVMLFAWIEMLALGAAFVVYSRHATDLEQIRLQADLLTVEHVLGGRVEHAEFVPDRVRVEPAHDGRSLIELSGQGQRIAVGRFVRPELRRQFADELRWALRLSPRWVVGSTTGLTQPSAGI